MSSDSGSHSESEDSVEIEVGGNVLEQSGILNQAAIIKPGAPNLGFPPLNAQQLPPPQLNLPKFAQGSSYPPPIGLMTPQSGYKSDIKAKEEKSFSESSDSEDSVEATFEGHEDIATTLDVPPKQFFPPFKVPILPAQNLGLPGGLPPIAYQPPPLAPNLPGKFETSQFNFNPKDSPEKVEMPKPSFNPPPIKISNEKPVFLPQGSAEMPERAEIQNFGLNSTPNLNEKPKEDTSSKFIFPPPPTNFSEKPPKMELPDLIVPPQPTNIAVNPKEAENLNFPQPPKSPAEKPKEVPIPLLVPPQISRPFLPPPPVNPLGNQNQPREPPNQPNSSDNFKSQDFVEIKSDTDSDSGSEDYEHIVIDNSANTEDQLIVYISSILQTLPSLLNHREMFLNSTYNSTYEFLKNLAFKIPDNHQLKSSLQLLLNSFNCDRCFSQHYESVTSCNHKLCKSCSIEGLKKYTNGLVLLTEAESNFYASMCPKCKKKLSENDLKTLLGQDWDYYNSQRAQRQRNQTQMDIESLPAHGECKMCQKPLTGASCFAIDTCGHLCKECLAFEMRRGKTKCKFCNTAYPADIVNETGTCEGCGRLMYYVGNYLTTICSGHLMCQYCLTSVFSSMKCKVCNGLVNTSIIEKLGKVLYSRCTGPCKLKKTREFFMLKDCCNEDICVDCQIVDHSFCAKCREPLGEWGLYQVQNLLASRK